MTKIFGIINVTPDSMSEDGTFDMNVIRNYIKKAAELGIYGVDVGAVATNPRATLISEEDEMNRLVNKLPEIIKLAHELNIKVSLDSYTPDVVEFGLKNGIDYINDVNGFKDQKIVGLALKYTNAKCVVMHSLSVPAVKGDIPDSVDIVELIISWANERVKTLSDLKDRLILDVGIGFSKTPKQDFMLLTNIDRIKREVPAPIYVGHSRKFFSYDGITADIAQKDVLTTAITYSLLQANCDYVRIHNIEYAKLCFELYKKQVNLLLP